MIPPQDLQNKKFSHTVRGYNPIEVDDYVKFLLAKYAQLYAENVDLEKRLHIVSGKYEELAGDEETIRNAVAQAKKLSQAMIENAKKTASQLTREVESRCDEILQQAQAKIESEKRELSELRAEAAKFRKLLLDEYSRHLNLMKQSSAYLPSDPEESFPAEQRLKEIVLDGIDPGKEMEDAIIAPSRDADLDEFKRFVRPVSAGVQSPGKDPASDRVNEEIYRIFVDDEDLADAQAAKADEQPDASETAGNKESSEQTEIF